MKWMKNEATLALRHRLVWAFRLGSDSSKLLWSFRFLRLWLQVLLHLKKRHPGWGVRISACETGCFLPYSSLKINSYSQEELPQISPVSPIFSHLSVELPLGFIIAGKNSVYIKHLRSLVQPILCHKYWACIMKMRGSSLLYYQL